MFKYDVEEFFLVNHKPWVPRPLLSMHVRMGDKACEMKVAEFHEYMNLANSIKSHFPHLQNIWLSTEMQVCDLVFKLLILEDKDSNMNFHSF